MKITKYFVYLILILLILIGCSNNEPGIADIHLPKDYVEHDAGDPADMDTLFADISIPSSPNIIYDEDSTSKLIWFNIDRELLHEHDVSDATLLESVHTANNLNSLLIHNLLSSHLLLLNLNTREVIDVNTPIITDSGDSFDNDYGARLLFAGWVDDPIEIVIFGNKTVYAYNELGKPDIIFDASKPIYGSALSPNKQLLSLLIASDDFIGAEADLIVLDLQGHIVYKKQRISYIAHSDGWNFLYPMEWINDYTVAVPLIGNGISPYNRGYALVNINEDTVTQENEPTLSDESYMLLKSELDSLEPGEIIKVLAKPTDEQDRYVAVNTSTQTRQVWLIDLLELKVTLLSEGLIIGWNEQGELIILQTSSVTPYYTKLNLN